MSGDESMPDAEVDRHFAELVEHFYDEQNGEGSTPDDREATSRPEATGERRLGPVRLDPFDPFDGEGAPGPRDHDLSAEWLFELDTERFVPEPPPPLPHLSTPSLVGSMLITAAVLVCLLAVVGVALPAWAGWLAITGFAVGMALLLSRLPRHRDPDDGDGAVL